MIIGGVLTGKEAGESIPRRQGGGAGQSVTGGEKGGGCLTFPSVAVMVLRAEVKPAKGNLS